MDWIEGDREGGRRYGIGWVGVGVSCSYDRCSKRGKMPLQIKTRVVGRTMLFQFTPHSIMCQGLAHISCFRIREPQLIKYGNQDA